MNTEWIHYLAGLNINALCGATPGFRKVNRHLISMFSQDVTCTGCLRKIAEMKDLGFVPKR